MTPTSSGPQQAAAPSLLRQLRDAATAIFRDGKPRSEHEDRQDPELAGSNLEPVAALTDAARLQALYRQRQILRWRDHTHAELLRTAQTLQARATQHIDSQLGEMGLVQKWIAPSADKVLKDWLFAEAMKPIDACWKLERGKLANLRTDATRLRSSDFIFEPSAAWLVQERFRPGNRDLLVQKIQEWMCGAKGPVSHYCRQASQMAHALVQPEMPC